MSVAGVLRSNRRGAIDPDALRRELFELRDVPGALVELVQGLLDECEEQAVGWLLPPVCGWMSLSELEEAGRRGEDHAAGHVGCDAARGLIELRALRRAGLSAPPVRHIAYPTEIVLSWIERQPLREGHPTWVSSSSGDGSLVGGTAGGPCPRCTGAGERLLSIAVPEGTRSSLSKVDFVWCPSCSPYTELATARLDEDGKGHLDSPELIVDVEPFEVDAFPETEVALVDLGPEWRVQDWMRSNGVENLHRVGGRPTWIQYEVLPTCPRCDEPMDFVAQVGVEDLCDGEGISYLHWCPPCSITGVVYQQT